MVVLGLVSLVVLFYFAAVFPSEIGRIKDRTDLFYFIIANAVMFIIGFIPTAYFCVSYFKIKSNIGKLPDFQIETVTGVPKIKQSYYSFPIYGSGGRRLGGSTQIVRRTGEINGIKYNFWAMPDSAVRDKPMRYTAITKKSIWLGCNWNRFVIEFSEPDAVASEAKVPAFDGEVKELIRKNLNLTNYIMEHYALLIQYAASGPAGDELQPAIAHFACVLAALSPHWWKIDFRDAHLIDSMDDIMILDDKKFPGYPMTFAEECLKEGDPKAYMEAIGMCIPKGDPNLDVAWSFAMQQSAKSQGRLKGILEQARKSPVLGALPEVFQFVNELHIDELSGMYGFGELCPDCNWEMAFLASIATMPAGDEIDHCYFQCENCNRYLVKHYHDRFDGETDISYSQISEEDAKAAIEKIRRCPNPQDKHCKCEVHKKW